MDFNPWNVSSLEDFHFYNCPECELKYASKEQFIGHAVINHPKAHEFIPTLTQRQPMTSDPYADPEVHLEHNVKIEPVEPIEQIEPEPVEPFSDIEPDVHWDNFEPMTNDIKQEILEDQAVIERPKKTKNYNRKGVFDCDQCDKTYSYRHHLKEHYQTVHQGLTFPCNQCDKVLLSHGGLAAHKKSQHPTENTKMYHCDFCAYASPIKGNFLAHCKRRHTSMLIQDQGPI